MKTTKFFMLAALALSATACSNDNDNNTTSPAPREAVITAGINTLATRANGATWEADNIGVMVTGVSGTTTGITSIMESLYKNVKYTTASTSSEAATFTATTGAGIFFQDANETVTFAAYGPYQPSTDAATLPGTNSDGVISGISTTNQSTRDAQKAFDFIYASGATATNTNFTVQFKDGNAFSHKMSRLIIKFEAATNAGFAATEVSNSESTYSVSGLYHDGTFNVTNGTAASTGTATSDWSLNSNSIRTESETSATTATFTSILYPQDHSASGLTVKATIAGQTYEATIKPNLESSKSYTYTITAKKQGLEVTGCTVTDWTDGGSETADATIPKNS